MSHLDEGRLHAYLDGEERQESEAHLSVCADCRRCLDEARRLRDRAGAILRAGVPGMGATPPFEDIAERKRRAEPRRAPRTMALAWAATIALALGLGWYARSLAPRETPASADVAAEPAATQPPPQVAAAPSTRRDAAPARQRAAASAERPPQLADRLAAAPAPVTDTTRAAQQQHAAEADTRLNTRDLARLAVERAAPSAGAPAQPPRAQPVAAAADEAETWVPVNRAEAERRLDDQLAALPGLETVGITVKEGAGVPYARTVQRLPDGRTVELTQERIVAEKREERAARAPAAEPAPAGAATPGRAAAQASASTVIVEWSNSRVTARGPLRPDSLRALLRRLGRAQPPEPDQLRDD